MSRYFYTVKMPDEETSAEAAPAAVKRGSYHHGDLRAELIRAAEEVIRERGVDNFSLRETARRAGVSAAAPQHHFGDAKGLLTAVATLGFEGLGAALAEANALHPGWLGRRARLEAQGRAYVDYALAEPARFDVMWRKARINAEDEAYRTAAEIAYGLIDAAIREGDPTADLESGPDPRTIAAWATVHGFARLALDGAFGPDPTFAANLMLGDVIARLRL